MKASHRAESDRGHAIDGGGTGRPPTRFGPWSRELLAFLELFALTGIAIAQPALDVLSENTEIFVARRTTTLQLFALTLIFVLGPAVALWGVEVVVGLLMPRLRRWIHAAFIAGVVAVLAVEVLRHQSDFGATLILALALPIGIAGGWFFTRFAAARTWLHFLAIAPLIFAGLFVFASPVTSAVLAGGPAAADARVRAPSRVVMIVFDEFPIESLLDGSGHVDDELFPNFAALASDSTWYRNATTVSPSTETAVPSILSGAYPADQYVIPVAAEYPHNLFTLLGDSYEMNVFESQTYLCPANICTTTPRPTGSRSSFRSLLSASSRLWWDFAKPSRPDETPTFVAPEHPRELQTGAAFVRSLQRTSRPRLDFLHILLPHEPWHYAASGQNYLATDLPGLGTYAEWLDDGASLSARQRHLLQVQATDQLLGDVIARLKRIRAYDDSLIVVTADHGVAFTTGSVVRGVSKENYPEIMWTPLFVKTPRQTSGEVDDRVALGIDVLPTIAAHLRVELPWSIDGRSLLGQPRSRTARRILSWEANILQPRPGREYLTVDGTRGFADVLTAAASNAGGDPALRLFRLGGYGDLVGLDPAPYVDHSAPVTNGRVVDSARFADVVPSRRVAPWLHLRGQLDGPAVPSRWVAVALNGRIAAVTATTRDPFRPNASIFSTALPPQMFRTGRNAIDLYLIEGNAFSPTLVPVALRAQR